MNGLVIDEKKIVQSLFQTWETPISWTVVPHSIMQRDRRGNVAPLQEGWRIEAIFVGSAGPTEPRVVFAVRDRFGSMDVAETYDARAQPFRYGPDRIIDLRYWTHISVYTQQWDLFLAMHLKSLQENSGEGS